MTVKHITIWKCSAECCGREEEQEYIQSVYAALDRSCLLPMPCLPAGWNAIEGRAYCGRHTVEVTAVVRTPTLLGITQMDGTPGRVFYAGDLEEVVRLRNAA